MHMMKLQLGNHLKSADVPLSCNILKSAKHSTGIFGFSKLELIPMLLYNTHFQTLLY